MNYGNIIIFDNESGQCINMPATKVLLIWDAQTERLFPITGTYWAVGVVRRASEEEQSTVRYGNQTTRTKTH